MRSVRNSQGTVPGSTYIWPLFEDLGIVKIFSGDIATYCDSQQSVSFVLHSVDYKQVTKTQSYSREGKGSPFLKRED